MTRTNWEQNIVQGYSKQNAIVLLASFVKWRKKHVNLTAMRYLQHEVEVGDLLCRPARVIIPDLEPGLHPLDVRALLEEVLVGAVVLQQVEQQQQAVLHHDTCRQRRMCIRT